MRLFLAINPPDDCRGDLWRNTAPLRLAAPDIDWVDESRLHLTLKFFGEVADAAVAPITDAIARVATSHAVMAIHVDGVGAFPNFRRPRVVWAGVNPDPRLELLHHDVEVACADLGYPIEGRPFRPHLTLARVRDVAEAGQLRSLRSAAGKLDVAHEFTLFSIDLMQSTYEAGRAVYRCLARAPLSVPAVAR